MMPLALKHSSASLEKWKDVLQLKFTKLTNVCLKTAIAKKWEEMKFLKHYLKTRQQLVENGFKTPAAFELVKCGNLPIRYGIAFFIKLHEHEKLTISTFSEFFIILLLI